MRAARPDAGGRGFVPGGNRSRRGRRRLETVRHRLQQPGRILSSCIGTMRPPNRRCSRPTGFANSVTFRWTDAYYALGRLRLAQGDLVSASALLDRAVELASLPNAIMPIWKIYHARGLVRQAQGRMPEALDDLGHALRLARAFRASAPGAEAARIGAESLLDEVYAAFIDVGNRLYERTRDPRLTAGPFRPRKKTAPPACAPWFPAAGLPAIHRPLIGKPSSGCAAPKQPRFNPRRPAPRPGRRLPRRPNPHRGFHRGPARTSPEDLLARVSATLPSDAVLFSFSPG
jgi:hypothetical protein